MVTDKSMPERTPRPRSTIVTGERGRERATETLENDLLWIKSGAERATKTREYG